MQLFFSLLRAFGDKDIQQVSVCKPCLKAAGVLSVRENGPSMAGGLWPLVCRTNLGPGGPSQSGSTVAMREKGRRNGAQVRWDKAVASGVRVWICTAAGSHLFIGCPGHSGWGFGQALPAEVCTWLPLELHGFLLGVPLHVHFCHLCCLSWRVIWETRLCVYLGQSKCITKWHVSIDKQIGKLSPLGACMTVPQVTWSQEHL